MTELWIFVSCPNRFEPQKYESYAKDSSKGLRLNYGQAGGGRGARWQVANVGKRAEGCSGTGALNN